jgi:antitoxin component YwqK of YwqJK toxin-antitoxin module
VHECDTNYSIAVYEEILALQADSVYEEAKSLALAGLRLPNSNKREFLLALANTYDYLKKRDSALFIYDSLTRMYPYYHQPWYEKGVVYFRNEQYDLAVSSFEHSLRLNPNHFRSHYMLGTVYAMQGRLSEGFMALEASLLMTQNATLASEVVNVLTKITEGTDEVIKYYKGKSEERSHPLFDEIDQLVASKLALDKKYKLKINLNENIFRQSQVIMEKLKYDPSDTNFAMQYYVPLLTDVFQNDMFESYMLLLFSGYNFETVNKLAEKKKSDIAMVKSTVFPYFNKIQATAEVDYNKRKAAREKYHYYSDNDVMIIGSKIEKNKEQTIIGDVSIYKGNHTLLSKGKYDNDGKKDGQWIYYYSNGKIKSKEIYSHGEQRDSGVYYSFNGNLSRVAIRDKSGDVISQYDYDYSGYLSEVRKRRSDKTIEEQSFHPNGVKKTTLFYEEGGDITDGTYITYHPNGKIKQEISISKGKYNGVYKSYYSNGKLNDEGTYSKGSLDGAYTAYYQSGQLKEKTTYDNGKADGPYEEYYDNGTLSEKGIYDKGSKSEVNNYTRSGRLYSVIEMRGKVPSSLKFTNEDNMVVYKKSAGSGLYEYSLYHANGNKAADIRLNAKGNKSGTITYYHSNGVKSDEVNYQDGNAHGRWTTYFKDGAIQSDINYKDDQKDGYYKYYYHNGSLQHEGWYKQDKKQGLWKTYHANGKTNFEVYYLNDEYDGHFKEFNIGGVAMNKYLHDGGVSIGQVCYDTAGVLTDSVSFNNNQTTYKFSHLKSATPIYDLEYDVRYGKADGHSVTKYVNGAIKDDNNYKRGNKDSLCATYYPDGTVHAKGMYVDGSKTGKWVSYNEAGELLQEASYENGSLEGKTKGYADGTVRVEYNYANNAKEGQQLYYGEDGRVALALIYSEGDLVGYTHEGKDGKLLPETKIKNGKATITAYYSNGQKSAEATVEQGLLKGSLKTYFTNGQLAEERNMNYTDLEGPFKRYNPDGKLVYEVVYKEDNEQGPEKTYDKNGNLLITANYYFGELHGATTVTASGKTRTYNYKYGQLISVE